MARVAGSEGAAGLGAWIGWVPHSFTPPLRSVAHPLYLFFGNPRERGQTGPAEMPIAIDQGDTST